MVVPLAFATASIGGVASADDGHDKDAAPVSVFCNNPFNFSIVDAGGGNGGLLGPVAKNLGIGLGAPGSIAYPPPRPSGDNANGGNGGQVEQSTKQFVAGNRCTVGDETHKKKVQVIKNSFNKIDQKKIIRGGY
ncbi:hypothetical protein ABZS81_21440 [Streptomyces sp. NPDC005318]|uniref:hypothetical protein n=1 Tax=Streptomyces sp. NPDC005318 TaxID=3157031 RepID=UPI0033A53190